MKGREEASTHRPGHDDPEHTRQEHDDQQRVEDVEPVDVAVHRLIAEVDIPAVHVCVR